MERNIHSRFAAAIIVAFVAACSADSPDRLASNATAAALQQPNTATVVIRITPDGRYFVNGELTAEHALTEKLRQSIDPNVTKPYTARIVAEEGVTGYYAVVAQNYARDAGFSRVEGYAEVPADPNARIAAAKRWTEDFTGAAASARLISVFPDTSRRH